jgi:hypothetical protein
MSTLHHNSHLFLNYSSAWACGTKRNVIIKMILVVSDVAKIGCTSLPISSEIKCTLQTIPSQISQIAHFLVANFFKRCVSSISEQRILSKII